MALNLRLGNHHPNGTLLSPLRKYDESISNVYLMSMWAFIYFSASPNAVAAVAHDNFIDV